LLCLTFCVEKDVGGAPKVHEELHGQRKLDEGMEASWKALASNGR